MGPDVRAQVEVQHPKCARQTAVNIKSPHMYQAEYNHAAYSKNVTPILNNGICCVDIFQIMPLFKICDTYAAMLYSVPFRLVCRGGHVFRDYHIWAEFTPN
jgi:hypothetical protein